MVSLDLRTPFGEVSLLTKGVHGTGDDEKHHGVGDQRLKGHKSLRAGVSGIVSVGLTAIALVSDT